ncbi:hypothetical protein A2824_03620 [Candidatus Nomurabacteria bacterium RIFCSPHIGHO2_01_FULL_42_16]|uniref:General secretion pathway GspH domain-containing protein n=1 Tax=Candidatus Nomurabacteria bacterium RIFCSPHIGHO2_01_FULL_42_16 TaxID=1801743 RepID=A0A1F6VK71_9BACT|nr:MAG: hypothetical protein A2824_03620 [Candidatus Nomurabacteria bacterium RIFCSPHIGHO2_01_FULL_42_16]
MKKLIKKLLTTNYFLLTSPRGFTLVETMIAVTLFTILMTIGSGAVLNTSSIYRKTANLRAAVDNLSFVMEDMARNLRLGSEYTGSDYIIDFKAVDGTPTSYIFDSNDNYKIKKQKGSGQFETLTLPEIEIDSSSGFELDNTGQPMVTIRISGKVIYKDLESEINLQTTVSQRLLE